ncbi:MAG: hypothetical protein M1269_00040 [Chloroflexi bacterium]|nr:hypothetical protein [Chloroflexota bacterium]
MKKIILLIIAIFFLIGAAYARPAAIIKGGDVFNLEGTLTYTNRSDQPENVIISVPELRSVPPYQEVLWLKYNYKGGLLEGTKGERWRVFTYSKLPPGKTAKIVFTAKIKIYDVVFPLDADIVREPGKELLANLSYWLAPDSYIQSDAPGIKGLALSLTGGIKNPYYKTLALYDYVRENIKFDLTLKPVTALEVLKNRIAQCSDATYYLMALLRAAGIPARFVNGIHINPGEGKVPLTHAWTEIYLEPYGWVPVDVTLGRFPSNRLVGFGEQSGGYVIFNRDVKHCFKIENRDMKKLSGKMKWKMFAERLGTIKDPRPLNLKLRIPENPSQSWDTAGDRQIRITMELVNKAGSAGDLKAAQGLLEKEIERVPDYIPAHRKLVEVVQSQNGLRGLLNTYEQLLKNKPGSPGLLYGAGITSFSLGRYEPAIEYLRKSVHKLKHPSVYLALGLAYMDSKQFRKSFGALDEALALDPNNINVNGALANLLTYDTDWLSLAEFCASASERVSNSFFPGQAAYAYTKIERFKDAVPWAEKAVQMDDSLGWYKALLGWCYMETGKKEEGKKLVKEALKQDTGFMDRKFYEELIKK